MAIIYLGRHEQYEAWMITSVFNIKEEEREILNVLLQDYAVELAKPVITMAKTLRLEQLREALVGAGHTLIYQ